MFYPGDVIENRFEVWSYSAEHMNLVFFVEDLQTKELLFAKTYKQDSPNKDILIQKFEEELAFSMEMGEHSNILTIRFIKEINGQPFLFTNYIEEGEKGNNLEKRIQAGLTFEEVLSLAWQICVGMEFLNQKREIAHLDLKPNNILVTPDNLIKISDFGLARNVSLFYNRPSRESAGSLYYKAPEHFNQEIVDTRSDIYSFGIILYRMLTNRFPFDTPGSDLSGEEILAFFKTYHATNEIDKTLFWHGIERLSQQAESSPSALPTDAEQLTNLGQILGGCLARAPERRYYQFQYVREAIEHCFPFMLNQKAQSAPIPTDYYLRGMDFQTMGKHTQALNFFNKALKKRSDEARIWYAAGISFEAIAEIAEARRFIQRAIQLDPEEELYQEKLETLA